MSSPAHYVNRKPASWSRPVSALQWCVSKLDFAFDRIYSSKLNPLYQSGTLVILCFLVVIVSGLYLFLFYSIDTPYASVERIENSIWFGSFARSIHTYAADLAVVAAVYHALKMFLAGRAWGPRFVAWISGLGLLFVTFTCAWTGQIMAWDQQGQLVVVELTKMIDTFPLFSIPVGRTFNGAEPVPGSFFFMNLFLHVSLPLGLAFMLWVHCLRMVRPRMLPPKALSRSVVLVLMMVSFVLPMPLAPRADLLSYSYDVPTDLYYNFWIPIATRVPAALHLTGWLVIGFILASIPWWWPKKRSPFVPSWVDPKLCTGCTTCYVDCPFDAISMVPRRDPGRQSEFFAEVQPNKCVSCGICSASCSPMSVGPEGTTGRDQLAGVKLFWETNEDCDRDLVGKTVLFACENNVAGKDSRLLDDPRLFHYPISCSGNLHTSVIEYQLRRGATGAFVLTCPVRDASCREGPKWLTERLFHGREAELHARVDSSRIHVCGNSAGELEVTLNELDDFIKVLEHRDDITHEVNVEIDTDCEPKEEITRRRWR